MGRSTSLPGHHRLQLYFLHLQHPIRCSPKAFVERSGSISSYMSANEMTCIRICFGVLDVESSSEGSQSRQCGCWFKANASRLSQVGDQVQSYHHQCESMVHGAQSTEYLVSEKTWPGRNKIKTMLRASNTCQDNLSPGVLLLESDLGLYKREIFFLQNGETYYNPDDNSGPL